MIVFFRYLIAFSKAYALRRESNISMDVAQISNKSYYFWEKIFVLYVLLLVISSPAVVVVMILIQM